MGACSPPLMLQAESFPLDEDHAAQLAGLVTSVRGSGAAASTVAECRSPTAAFMADIYEVRRRALCFLSVRPREVAALKGPRTQVYESQACFSVHLAGVFGGAVVTGTADAELMMHSVHGLEKAGPGVGSFSGHVSVMCLMVCGGQPWYLPCQVTPTRAVVVSQEIRARTATLLQQGGVKVEGTRAAADLARMVLNFKQVCTWPDPARLQPWPQHHPYSLSLNSLDMLLHPAIGRLNPELLLYPRFWPCCVDRLRLSPMTLHADAVFDPP